MIMRARRSAWSAACLAAGLVLSLAAVGCGDDDDGDDTPAAGAGGKTAGTGGKGGGGAGGKGGTGGGGSSADPAKCVTDTTAILKDQPGALSGTCISCICKEKPADIIKCNAAKDGNCWALIGCVADKCGSVSMGEQATCAGNMCGPFLTAAGEATAAGKAIQEGACAKTCVDDGGDAGTKDAGN